ncbi:hypothetical protein GOP47_0010160 [Adiantum capillus-veneris]|uniref:Uncharacterized protein n=1 Tax=Adiantum capillus-veneris TaxID=13818 RepID=A0A9D4ZG53_ADICA|nr:hypothetical protein GOP47_0010160 [Adiantum capillus-veneris]
MHADVIMSVQTFATRRAFASAMLPSLRSLQNFLRPSFLLKPPCLSWSSLSTVSQPESITNSLRSPEVEFQVTSTGASTLTPSKVVEILDRFIVGQAEAKRAVAVALRNRWRRHRVPFHLKEDIVPKNILMIGPTGCGKTEVARRLAKLADAPFVKVEATKFTEVGFHGRDVDHIIRDLAENAIQLQRQKVRDQLIEEVEETVAQHILFKLTGLNGSIESGSLSPEEEEAYYGYRQLYYSGGLDAKIVSVDLPEGRMRMPIDVAGLGGFGSSADFVYKIEKVSKGHKVEMPVREARERMVEIEMEKHLSTDQITRDALQLAESDGIVFIDEIDKIVKTSEMTHGADASAEGVQRDLLPIIEGSMVSTKYGNISTDHILFICSGAFHSCKPSDMLAELQGRLPIRVELKGLTKEDLYRILTEPKTNLIKQQVLLMKTEGVDLVFTDAAVRELANVADEVNRFVDNIGARRLHTVIERVVEDISYSAPEKAGTTHTIDKEKVRSAVGHLLMKTDISKFVL